MKTVRADTAGEMARPDEEKIVGDPTLPSVPPTLNPANGNKGPLQSLALARPLVPIGLGLSA